jgi:hypothetical protein
MSRTLTFPEAYRFYGPDVQRIAGALGIEPAFADRLINAAMEEKWQARLDAKNPNDLKAFFAKRQEENRALRAGA